MKSPSQMLINRPRNGFQDQQGFRDRAGERQRYKNAILVFQHSKGLSGKFNQLAFIGNCDVMNVLVNFISPAPIKAVLLALIGEKQLFHSINIR
jgi:hypothetical protein